MVEEAINEGKILKEIVRLSGKTQDEFAAMLGMVRGTLIYHMSKDRLTDDFKYRLKEAGIDLTTHGLVNYTGVQQGAPALYNVDIPLKKMRAAKMSIPKDTTKEDIDLIIEYLKLMRKSKDE